MTQPIERERYSRGDFLSDTLETDDELVAFIPRSSQEAYDVDSSRALAENRGTWTTSISSLRRLYENNTGLLLITLSQLFGSCMNVSVKLLNGLDPPVPPFELVAIRMMFTYIFSIAYMYHQKVPHTFLGPPGVRMLLVVRGVSGFFGLFGMYYSLQYLSLSDAVVLTFLIPTVTAISGYFLLNEGFSRGQAMAGFFSLLGVVLIARPTFLFGDHAVNLPPSTTSPVGDLRSIAAPAERGTASQRLGAVGVSLLGVLGATGAVTTLRAIGTRAHTLHSLTYFSSYSILVSVLGMLVFRMKFIIPAQWQWGLLFLVVGLCGYAAQICLVLGLQRETASRGMLAMYTQIIFSTILERLIFHVYPSYLSILGAAIILSSAMYVALTKKPPQRQMKTPMDDIETQTEEEPPMSSDDVSGKSKESSGPHSKI
ncbi:hypothetical protein BD410DRAFT_899584 [Rickenella mellea]|uniref:EamA domain-containing protein n=1 Tax=Rickenella mellea TaxID=50990 RepID=A0A4Y7PYI1_9AGAM|nr:hypothetical protein BD410DRAFT_899584 [Rickenella mellea]